MYVGCFINHCFHFRYNERLLARLESERETPQYKSRTTRLAKWRELVVLANAELELPPAVPERIEQLGFCFWRMDANSCSVCKPGNTLQNARSIFQHVPSFFLHFPCATLCNQSVV